MDEEQRRHLEEKRQLLWRRLQHLEKQAVTYGLRVSPEVAMEIEDARTQLASIEATLGLQASASSSSSKAQEPSQNPYHSTGRNRGNRPIFVIVGLIAGVIAIVGFVIDKQRQQETAAQGLISPSSSVSATVISTTVSTVDPALVGTSQSAKVPVSSGISSTGAPATVPAASATTIPVNQALQIYPADFHVTLTSIQLLPDGTMRWNFDLWNKTIQAGAFTINQNSYITDNLGKHYGVLKTFEINLEAGVRTSRSADFEAPQPSANAFTLHIGGFAGVGVVNSLISVQSLLVSGEAPEPTTTPAGAITVGQELQIYPADFHVTLTSIQLLPDGTMRWNFDLWNKTIQAGAFTINQNSYITDNLGKHYGVLKTFEINLEAGVRTSQSADFEAPQPSANAFTLHIGGFAGVGVLNPEIRVPLPLH